MKTYIDALAGSLERTALHRGAAVTRVTRDGDGYVIEDEAGGQHPVDQVILATNARQALGLVEHLPDLEPVCRELRRFEYFDTTIAIHGDRRLMPDRESAWSVVNARWDGSHSQLSIWNREHGLPVFKSWVTFDAELPEPLYAVATYEHGKVTPEYFDAQRRLKDLQGLGGVWLAGLYTDDADSHEGAVRSAVTVAESLAPGSKRLAQLLSA